MNTSEFFQKVLELTGDERPSLTWTVSELGVLMLDFAYLLNSKPFYSSPQKTGGHGNWARPNTDKVFYDMTIGLIRRKLDEDKGIKR